MRVTSMLADIQYQMQQSQQALATATQQVSTSLRVNQLSDDPAASANMVLSLGVSANVDTYTSNISSVTPQMQTADSAMASIVTSLNTAITLGTSGANGTNSAANTQAIASQVQGLLTSIVAKGNTSFQGVYLFGGTENGTPPFVAASTTYTSSVGTAANSLSVGTTASIHGNGTLLTPGSVTTITDAGGTGTFTYTAQAGDTIKNLTDAITQAASAGTVLPSTVSATLDGSGQLVVADSANNLTMSSNDSVLGGMTATNAKTATSTSGSLVEGTTAFVAGNGTAMTAGSITTIGDASTGGTMTFQAKAGDTLANLNAAIGAAVTAGTLSAGTTATINAAGQLSIGTNSATDGIAVNTDDAALGSMSAASSTAVANAYAYVGNSTVNSVQVGESMSVPTNLPGNQLLISGANVIGSLNELITALQSGSATQIGAATTAVSTALNYVSQQRVPLDNTISQLNAENTSLSSETITLKTQQTALVGITLADAATNLSQAELDNSAVLAAAAKIAPQTLLDYLK